MRKIHLVRRQLTGSLHQAAIFVLCVVLSLVTLVSLSGFSRSVHSSFLKDARALHAADIIIHADPRGRAEPHGGAFAEMRAGDAS